jgi:hypothetical protein
MFAIEMNLIETQRRIFFWILLPFISMSEKHKRLRAARRPSFL